MISRQLAATPLLLLLLSSAVQAQYTLRGRVVDHAHSHGNSLDRREESAPAKPAATGNPDTNTDKNTEGDDQPPQPEASESTHADKGEDGGHPAVGDEGDADGGDQGGDQGRGDDNSSDTSHDGGGGGGGRGNSLYLVSHEDFCVYGPSDPNTPIAQAGENVVSWCTKDHGTKQIPEGTLSAVTYVKTPNFVQVSGYGDFSKINIAPDDAGGQLDSSKHTPNGAQLLLGADKSPAQSWVTIIGKDTFCVRACTGDPQYCPTQYDTLGCSFLTNDGVGWPEQFQDCEGEDGPVPGVFNGQTYTVGQGDPPKPTAPAVSNCNGGGAPGGAAPTGSDHASTGGHESGSNTSSGGRSSSGSGTASSSSEQWLPVETCVPCAGARAASGSGSGPSSASGSGHASSISGSAPALSGTTEVGMSQLVTGGSLSDGASALAGSPTAAPGPGGDALIQKRQAKSDGGSEGGGGDDGDGSSSEGGGDKTVTKGDQCCFTTWTPAGGAKPTGTGAGAGSGTGTGAKAGATTAPFGGMSNAAPTASKAVNGSGVAGAGNKTVGAGNGTGNGSDSGAGSWRGEAFSVDGMGKIVVGLVLGLIGGGWSLV